MKNPSPKIQVLVQMKNGYLRISVRKPGQRAAIKKLCAAEEKDLELLFWGETKVREIQNLMLLSRRERVLLAEGDTLGKRAPRKEIEEYIREKKQARLIREKSIIQTEKVLRELHKLFLRERRAAKATSRRVSSVIIPYMDGSTLLWLNVAQKKSSYVVTMTYEELKSGML
jgi:hypothetical protein